MPPVPPKPSPSRILATEDPVSTTGPVVGSTTGPATGPSVTPWAQTVPAWLTPTVLAALRRQRDTRIPGRVQALGAPATSADVARALFAHAPADDPLHFWRRLVPTHAPVGSPWLDCLVWAGTPGARVLDATTARRLRPLTHQHVLDLLHHTWQRAVDQRASSPPTPVPAVPPVADGGPGVSFDFPTAWLGAHWMAAWLRDVVEDPQATEPPLPGLPAAEQHWLLSVWIPSCLTGVIASRAQDGLRTLSRPVRETMAWLVQQPTAIVPDPVIAQYLQITEAAGVSQAVGLAALLMTHGAHRELALRQRAARLLGRADGAVLDEQAIGHPNEVTAMAEVLPWREWLQAVPVLMRHWAPENQVITLFGHPQAPRPGQTAPDPADSGDPGGTPVDPEVALLLAWPCAAVRLATIQRLGWTPPDAAPPPAPDHPRHRR